MVGRLDVASTVPIHDRDVFQLHQNPLVTRLPTAFQEYLDRVMYKPMLKPVRTTSCAGSGRHGSSRNGWSGVAD
jgi:hypothetical protein